MVSSFIGFLLAASAFTQSPQADMRPGEKVIKTALVYNIDPIMAVKVINCESGFKHKNLYGDGGLAYGIAQFHRGTFDLFKKEAGVPELEYTNEDHQIELFSWAMANGKERHWSCWKKLRYA